MASALQLLVEFVKDDVRQERRERAALRRTLLAALADPVLHQPRLEEREDEPQDATVPDVPCEPCHESVVVHLVEELLEVEIDHRRVAFGHIRASSSEGVVCASIRSESVT